MLGLPCNLVPLSVCRVLMGFGRVLVYCVGVDALFTFVLARWCSNLPRGTCCLFLWVWPWGFNYHHRFTVNCVSLRISLFKLPNNIPVIAFRSLSSIYECVVVLDSVPC